VQHFWQRLQGAQTGNFARLNKTDPPVWALWLMSHAGPVRRLLGRMVGLGFRREHVLTDERV
jgi:hypothetical protein